MNFHKLEANVPMIVTKVFGGAILGIVGEKQEVYHVNVGDVDYLKIDGFETKTTTADGQSFVRMRDRKGWASPELIPQGAIVEVIRYKTN